MSREYLVTWQCVIDGDDPVDVARKAREMQLDPDSTAVVFEIEPMDADEKTTVDLLEGWTMTLDADSRIIAETRTCDRHGGPWGSDQTCPACTFEDGSPRPLRGDKTTVDLLEHPLPEATVEEPLPGQVRFWTFVGHWENDRIVIEYVLPGVQVDTREDTGYWEQGLFAESASGRSTEEALDKIRAEYETPDEDDD